MSSSYVLATNLLGWRHTVPSTAEDLSRARAANDRLLACLAIEEAFAILVANYASFEKAIAGANIENMIEREVSRSALEGRRRDIDRNLVNLLAAGEMFTEHVRHRMRKGYGRDSREVRSVEAAFSSERERLVGFWAAECLRDAVLHNSLPVTSWTTGGQWVDLEGPDGTRDKRHPDARLEHSVTFSFDPDLLALDRKVDRALISQLKARADKNGKVSWVPIIREYVEALSLVLKEVRVALEHSEHTATELLSQLINEFRSTLPEEAKQPQYVYLVQRDAEDRWVEEVVLNLGIEDRLIELRKLHRPIINLHRRALRG